VIVMIDNYDSFTYNLVQELAEVGDVEIDVVRNDATTADKLLASEPQAIVISPGPGVPENSGVTMDVVRAASDLPLLGICLGHQAIAAVHGGRVVRAQEPVHGKTSMILHKGEGLFEGLPESFEATRYHSLIVDRESVPADLEITAWTGDGVIMGLRDRRRPHFGIQFHPESYLCHHGKQLLARFLEIAGLDVRSEWKASNE
jgi:anthranilate synthase/aminodeoxychorismate synthase-like glutamine amidotransferase